MVTRDRLGHPAASVSLDAHYVTDPEESSWQFALSRPVARSAHAIAREHDQRRSVAEDLSLGSTGRVVPIDCTGWHDTVIVVMEPVPTSPTRRTTGSDWRKYYPYSSVMPHRELAHVVVLREHTTRWL